MIPHCTGRRALSLVVVGLSASNGNVRLLMHAVVEFAHRVMVVERLDGWIVSEMIYYVLMKTLARLTAWMDGRLDVFDVGDVIMTAGSANARLTDAVTQSRSKCTPASVYSVYAVHNCQCRSSRIDAADPPLDL